MLPDRVSNPGPLTYESGALPIALRGPAQCSGTNTINSPQNQYDTSLSMQCITEKYFKFHQSARKILHNSTSILICLIMLVYFWRYLANNNPKSLIFWGLFLFFIITIIFFSVFDNDNK